MMAGKVLLVVPDNAGRVPGHVLTTTILTGDRTVGRAVAGTGVRVRARVGLALGSVADRARADAAGVDGLS